MTIAAHRGFLEAYTTDMANYGCVQRSSQGAILLPLIIQYSYVETGQTVSILSGADSNIIHTAYNTRRKPVIILNKTLATKSVNNYSTSSPPQLLNTSSYADTSISCTCMMYMYDLLSSGGFQNPAELGFDKKGYAYEDVPIVKAEFSLATTIDNGTKKYKITNIGFNYSVYDLKTGEIVRDMSMLSSSKGTIALSDVDSYISVLESRVLTAASSEYTITTSATFGLAYDVVVSKLDYAVKSAEFVIYRRVSSTSHVYTSTTYRGKPKTQPNVATGGSVTIDNLEPVSQATVFDHAPIKTLSRIRAIDSGSWVSTPTGMDEGSIIARLMQIPYNSIYGNTSGGSGYLQILSAATSAFNTNFERSNAGKLWADYSDLFDYVVENISIVSSPVRTAQGMNMSFNEYFEILALLKLYNVPSNEYALFPYHDAVFSFNELYTLAKLDLSLPADESLSTRVATYVTHMGLTSGLFYSLDVTSGSTAANENKAVILKILGGDVSKVPALLANLKKTRIEVLIRRLQRALAEAVASSNEVGGSLSIVNLSKAFCSPGSGCSIEIAGTSIDTIITDWSASFGSDGSFSSNVSFVIPSDAVAT